MKFPEITLISGNHMNIWELPETNYFCDALKENLMKLIVWVCDLIWNQRFLESLPENSKIYFAKLLIWLITKFFTKFLHIVTSKRGTTQSWSYETTWTFKNPEANYFLWCIHKEQNGWQNVIHFVWVEIIGCTSSTLCF